MPQFKGKNLIAAFYQRYLIDAMGAMAKGLFASLIIGLILSQIAKIPGFGVLQSITGEVLAASSPVIGAAIGVAIAFGLGVPPLAIFASAATGALGYQLGGPVGAYLAAVVGAEFGRLVGGRTPIDIVITPATVIITGGLVAIYAGPVVSAFMSWLGSVINSATEIAPFPMGMAVAMLMGLALTAPISSAAIAIMLGLEGLAAGAATVGCCAQMVGFAVISYKDNGVGGLLSQGLGTSMLQVPNILKHPQIWIAPTVAGTILGPVSTCLVKLTNTPAGAGMGTSGLVGPLGTWADMSGTMDPLLLVVAIIVMYFVLPALLSLVIHWATVRLGWVKPGYMKLSD